MFISSSISTLEVSLPLRTDRLSTGDLLTLQALTDPRTCLVFPPCSKSLTQSLTPGWEAKDDDGPHVFPHVLGDLHSVPES